MLSTGEIHQLSAAGIYYSDARNLAQDISDGGTLGGVLDYTADAETPAIDPEAFIAKYCAWWPIAKLLFKLAKVFTNPKWDAVLDTLIAFGDEHCG
jgi:hypothetical protein